MKGMRRAGIELQCPQKRKRILERIYKKEVPRLRGRVYWGFFYQNRKKFSLFWHIMGKKCLQRLEVKKRRDIMEYWTGFFRIALKDPVFSTNRSAKPRHRCQSSFFGTAPFHFHYKIFGNGIIKISSKVPQTERRKHLPKAEKINRSSCAGNE